MVTRGPLRGMSRQPALPASDDEAGCLVGEAREGRLGVVLFVEGVAHCCGGGLALIGD